VAVADVTGILAASAVVVGPIVAVSQRRKIVSAYRDQMTSKCSALFSSIEQQLVVSIELVKELAAA